VPGDYQVCLRDSLARRHIARNKSFDDGYQVQVGQSTVSF
jgi:hypothetical protein